MPETHIGYKFQIMSSIKETNTRTQTYRWPKRNKIHCPTLTKHSHDYSEGTK